jgi:hypothetical protein
MSLPTMHHTDSKALPILQFTALRAVVRQRTLEIELEESPELLSEALFERCAPAPFWSEALLAASAPPKARFTAAEVQPTLPPDVCMLPEGAAPRWSARKGTLQHPLPEIRGW